MRRLTKQFSAATLSVLSVTALAGSTAFACGMGSDNQNNQSNTSADYSYGASSQVGTDTSAYLANSHTYDYSSRGNRSNVGTEASDRMLDRQLRRHAMLAVQSLRVQHQQSDLQNAIETNNQALADTVNQLYPGTRAQFLQLWRDHVRYYQQYLTASERGDATGRQQAMQDLASFESEMADLLANANSQIDRANLEQQLATHSSQTMSIIDNVVAGNSSAVSRLAQEGYQHMDSVAAAMTNTSEVDLQSQ